MIDDQPPLKYSSAAFIGSKEMSLPVKTPELAPVMTAFVANVGRITTMLMFPVVTAQLGLEYGKAEQRAHYQIQIESFPHLVGNEPDYKLPSLAEKTCQLMEDALEKKPLEEVGKEFRDMFGRIDYFSSFGADVRPGAIAIFNSMIVQTWTAFEVMAGDLWEAALNAHPGTLAHINGKSWGKEYDDDQSKTNAVSGAKGIDLLKYVELDRLARNSFDLSRKMGTTLRDRFAFDKLSSIRQAYSRAFSKKQEMVKESLTNPCFDHISAVRNLIVHRAGVVDQKFKGDIAPLQSSPFLGLCVGDSLTVDGAVTADLIKPVFLYSALLIAAVDKWIQDSYARRDAKPHNTFAS